MILISPTRHHPAFFTKFTASSGTNRATCSGTSARWDANLETSIRALRFPRIFARRGFVSGSPAPAIRRRHADLHARAHVDDRLTAQPPVVMFPLHARRLQLRNAPGSVRIFEHGNRRRAAPRPQIIGGPRQRGLDQRYPHGRRPPAISTSTNSSNAPDKFRCVRFDFGHHYNQTSRERFTNGLASIS